MRCDREGRLNACLLLRLLAQADHVAGLALIGGDVDQLLVHRNRLVAHQLARLGAGRSEAHAVDHVVQPALQELQQSFAGRSRTARRLLIIVAELALQHSVHAAQFLLLAQLQSVLRQALLALALHAAGRHFELALRLERLDTALQEQIGSLSARQLTFRTGVLCHYEPLGELSENAVRKR